MITDLEIERLRALPYDEYLQTAHWQNLREKALLRADHRCQLCNGTESLNVHHRLYDRGCEELRDLVALCRRCHGYHHRIMAAENATAASIKDSVPKFLAELDRRRGAVADSPGEAIATGWRDLDILLCGLFPSELTVIAARPAVGKTMLGNALARHVASRGIPSLISSLEQRGTELISRMICAEGKIPSQHLRRGLLPSEEAERLLDAADRLEPLPIWIDDSSSQDLLRIAANARRLRQEAGLRLLVVDYLQMILPENRREPRHEQVAAISRGLKTIARELEIPVVALAQLNRQPEDRRDRRPRLSDLRESGEIEQVADCVILLHKPEDPDDQRKLDKLEVIVAKQRNGPTGEVFLMHDKQHFKIENYGSELPLLDV